MRLHKREHIVSKARTDLMEAVLRWADAHDDLTNGEYVSVLNGAFSDLLGTWAKYAIREERHGNQDTPGGLAEEGEK